MADPLAAMRGFIGWLVAASLHHVERSLRCAAAATAAMAVAVSGCASPSGTPPFPIAGNAPGGALYGGPTGVRCPSAWTHASLLLPCSDVPSSLVTDPTGNSGTQGLQGCSSYASETFVTVSADDLDAATLQAAAGSRAARNQRAGAPLAGEILVSTGQWCRSADSAVTALSNAVKQASNGQPIPGPTIGQKAFWSQEQNADGLRTTGVSWAEGPVVAVIYLVGPGSASGEAAAAVFAREQDSRIRSAAGPPASPPPFAPGTSPTYCPPAWAAAPFIPCTQLPHGLFPDPGAASSFLGQNPSISQLPGCAISNGTAYDTGGSAPNPPAASAMIFDFAKNCGQQADTVYRQFTAGMTGHTASAGIGTESLISTTAGGTSGTGAGAVVVWVDKGWVALIVDFGPAASTSAVERLARAQDARL